VKGGVKSGVKGVWGRASEQVTRYQP